MYFINLLVFIRAIRGLMRHLGLFVGICVIRGRMHHRSLNSGNGMAPEWVKPSVHPDADAGNSRLLFDKLGAIS